MSKRHPLNLGPKKKFLGSRTGQDVLAGKIIRVDEYGFENFSDYWTDPDSDLSSAKDLKQIVSEVEDRLEKSIQANDPIDQGSITAVSPLYSSSVPLTGSPSKVSKRATSSMYEYSGKNQTGNSNSRSVTRSQSNKKPSECSSLSTSMKISSSDVSPVLQQSRKDASKYDEARHSDGEDQNSKSGEKVSDNRNEAGTTILKPSAVFQIVEPSFQTISDLNSEASSFALNSQVVLNGDKVIIDNIIPDVQPSNAVILQMTGTEMGSISRTVVCSQTNTGPSPDPCFKAHKRLSYGPSNQSSVDSNVSRNLLSTSKTDVITSKTIFDSQPASNCVHSTTSVRNLTIEEQEIEPEDTHTCDAGSSESLSSAVTSSIDSRKINPILDHGKVGTNSVVPSVVNPMLSSENVEDEEESEDDFEIVEASHLTNQTTDKRRTLGTTLSSTRKIEDKVQEDNIQDKISVGGRKSHLSKTDKREMADETKLNKKVSKDLQKPDNKNQRSGVNVQDKENTELKSDNSNRKSSVAADEDHTSFNQKSSGKMLSNSFGAASVRPNLRTSLKMLSGEDQAVTNQNSSRKMSSNEQSASVRSNRRTSRKMLFGEDQAVTNQNSSRKMSSNEQSASVRSNRRTSRKMLFGEDQAVTNQNSSRKMSSNEQSASVRSNRRTSRKMLFGEDQAVTNQNSSRKMSSNEQSASVRSNRRTSRKMLFGEDQAVTNQNSSCKMSSNEQSASVRSNRRTSRKMTSADDSGSTNQRSVNSNPDGESSYRLQSVDGLASTNQRASRKMLSVAGQSSSAHAGSNGTTSPKMHSDDPDLSNQTAPQKLSSNNNRSATAKGISQELNEDPASGHQSEINEQSDDEILTLQPKSSHVSRKSSASNGTASFALPGGRRRLPSKEISSHKMSSGAGGTSSDWTTCHKTTSGEDNVESDHTPGKLPPTGQNTVLPKMNPSEEPGDDVKVKFKGRKSVALGRKRKKNNPPKALKIGTGAPAVKKSRRGNVAKAAVDDDENSELVRPRNSTAFQNGEPCSDVDNNEEIEEGQACVIPSSKSVENNVSEMPSPVPKESSGHSKELGKTRPRNSDSFKVFKNRKRMNVIDSATATPDANAAISSAAPNMIFSRVGGDDEANMTETDPRRDGTALVDISAIMPAPGTMKNKRNCISTPVVVGGDKKTTRRSNLVRSVADNRRSSNNRNPEGESVDPLAASYFPQPSVMKRKQKSVTISEPEKSTRERVPIQSGSTLITDTSAPLPRYSLASPLHYFETEHSMLKKKQRMKEKHRQIIRPKTTADDGLRRSRRNRVPVLDWFRNERIRYSLHESGLVVDGIDSPDYSRKESRPVEKIVKRFERQANMKQRRLKKLASPARNLSIHGAASTDPTVTSDTIPVVNPVTKEEVMMDCIKTRNQFQLVGPSGEPAQPSDPLVLCKPIRQQTFSSGLLILRPLEMKKLQYVKNDTMVFTILFGKVEVTIHRTKCILESGDKFFVPIGNVYSIQNLRNDEAKLDFVQIRGK